MDLDEKNSLLYLADRNQITILTLKLEKISSWEYPMKTTSLPYRGLKIDEDVLYLIIYKCHQIFVHNREDGEILNRWGTTNESKKQGEFHNPFGITVNNKYVYICDCFNHRVQVLNKRNGSFENQWGKGIEGCKNREFTFVKSIYNNKEEEIFYVGDDFSVQLFKKNGVWIQRIGDQIKGTKMGQFNRVFGMCVVDEQLYVVDNCNNRVQIFRRRS